MAKANPLRFSTKYQDDEADLLYYGYRYYNAITGRWTSRDRLTERDGPAIYVACRNGLSSDVDYLGLWRIERNPSFPRALAWPDPGDTIRGLAHKVRLNEAQWKRWAKVELSSTAPRDLDTPLSACDVFSVPNTAYVDYDATGITLPLSVLLHYYRHLLIARWRSEGYHVVSSRWIMGKDIVLSHLNDPNIYAYAFIGHGATGILVLGDDEGEWIWPGRYTPFGLVEMQLIACETNYGADEWRKNVSRAGLLITVQGPLTSMNIDFQVHSGE